LSENPADKCRTPWLPLFQIHVAQILFNLRTGINALLPDTYLGIIDFFNCLLPMLGCWPIAIRREPESYIIAASVATKANTSNK